MSESNNSSSASGGIGFAGLLTIVFITLKLLGKIMWSWWWVLSPLWISFLLVTAIIAGVLGIAGATMLGAYLLTEYDDRKVLRQRRERAERLTAERGKLVTDERKGGG